MTGGLDGELLAHGKALRALARALVGERHADDLVQDTMVQALQHRGAAPDAPRAWLTTVLRFLAHKLRRGERRRAARERTAATGRGAGTATVAPAADAGLEARDAFHRVTAAVEALPEPYQSTILLRYLRELAPADVAAALGVPVATVKTRLVRGLTLLRERFDAEQRARGGDWRAGLAAAFGIERAAAAGAAAVLGGVMTMASVKWAGAAGAAAMLFAVAWWLGREAPPGPSDPGPEARGDAAVAAATIADAEPRAAAGPAAAAREAAGGAPIAAAGLATIHGRLVDEDGVPLPGTAVELRGRRFEGMSVHDFEGEYSDWIRARGGRRWTDQEVTTGADGRFTFAAEPTPMSLALWVRRGPLDHAMGIDPVREPRDVDLGDLTVPVACALRCRVVDDRGRVVPSPSIHVDGPRDEPMREATSRVFAAQLASSMDAHGGGVVAATLVAGTFVLDVRGRRIVSGATVVVPAGTPSATHEILVAAAATDDAIRGTVVDERGVPLAGVQVIATREVHSWACTDALGRFTVQRGEQQDGEVELGFDKDGFEWAPSRHRARWGDHDLRFVLRDLVAIEVRAVDDERGEPVPDFTVWLFQVPGEGQGRHAAHDRASGEHEHGIARIDGIERGEHRVIVVPHRVDLWRSDAVLVEAVPGRVARAEVRLRRAAERTLRVQRSDGSAVLFADVELIDAAASAPEPVGAGTQVVALDRWDPTGLPPARVLLQQAKTARDGAVRLRGPAGMPALARVTGNGFAPFVVAPFLLDDPGELVATIPLGATVVARVGPPEVVRELLAIQDALGDTRRNPGFRLRRGTGRAAELVPAVANAPVRLGADGTFTITGAPAGDWQVALDPWEGTPGGDDFLVWTGAAVPLASVALRDGETTEVALDLAAWLPGTLTGVVRCNGVPVVNARIGIEVARPQLGHARPSRFMSQVTTDGAGRFRYRGRGGAVTVLVDRGDPDPWRSGNNWVAAAAAIALPANGTVEQDADVLACPLRVRLVTAAGAPVAATKLHLATDDGMRTHRLGPTDAGGGAAGDVEPATFAVRAGDPNGPVLARVTVVAGAANEVTVTVPDGR